MTGLQKVRARIDAVDEQIVKLFCERMALAGQAGAAKLAQGQPLTNTARELEIVTRMARLAGPEFAPYACRLFNALFELAKDYQVHSLIMPKRDA